MVPPDHLSTFPPDHLGRCAPEWDFLHLVEEGILPTDLCTRPHYC